jgi:hypothetical protein
LPKNAVIARNLFARKNIANVLTLELPVLILANASAAEMYSSTPKRKKKNNRTIKKTIIPT